MSSLMSIFKPAREPPRLTCMSFNDFVDTHFRSNTDNVGPAEVAIMAPSILGISEVPVIDKLASYVGIPYKTRKPDLSQFGAANTVEMVRTYGNNSKAGKGSEQVTHLHSVYVCPCRTSAKGEDEQVPGTRRTRIMGTSIPPSQTASEAAQSKNSQRDDTPSIFVIEQEDHPRSVVIYNVPPDVSERFFHPTFPLGFEGTPEEPIRIEPGFRPTPGSYHDAIRWVSACTGSSHNNTTQASEASHDSSAEPSTTYTKAV